MFIFGWGHTKSKNYGPVEKYLCSNCHNDDYWSLYKSSTWFTIFSIPVFPYKTEHYLLCPICSNELIIEDNKEYFKSLAITNSQLLDGEINESEYTQKIAEIESNYDKNNI